MYRLLMRVDCSSFYSNPSCMESPYVVLQPSKDTYDQTEKNIFQTLLANQFSSKNSTFKI